MTRHGRLPVRQALVLGLSVLLAVTGCANTRVVRLDTGQGRPLEYRPSSGHRAREVDELERLAREAATPGSSLNKLLTRRR